MAAALASDKLSGPSGSRRSSTACKVEAKQGFRLAVENIERGAWPRVDLEEPGLLAIDQEIGAAEALEAECRGHLLDLLRETRLQLRGKLGRLHRAAIAPFRVLWSAPSIAR